MHHDRCEQQADEPAEGLHSRPRRRLVERRLAKLRETVEGTENLLSPLRQTLEDCCSFAESRGAMRDVFGR